MTINRSIRRIESNVERLLAELVDTSKPNPSDSIVPSILLHYWHSQRLAVEVNLPVPRTALRAVYEPLHMRGIEGGTFVDVLGYGERVPSELYEIIRMHGWTVIRIDDSAARLRARNR